VLGAILQRYELGGGVELKDVEGEVQLGEMATLTPKKWLCLLDPGMQCGKASN
jgi:hypothetical protein